MLKYEQIAKEIEEYINRNNLPKGTRLQTVEELIAIYKVSKTTIVKALEYLALKGIVYQVRGSGIFVRKISKTGYLNLNVMTGFTSNFNESHKISSKVIEFNTISSNEEQASLLECKIGDKIYLVKRIRYIDNQIMCLEEAHYNKKFVPFLTEDIIKNSIFKYLTEVLKLNMGFADNYIHIDKLDRETAELLELELNDPTMIFLQQLYLTSGNIFNFTKITYHYENIKFSLQAPSI